MSPSIAFDISPTHGHAYSNGSNTVHAKKANGVHGLKPRVFSRDNLDPVGLAYAREKFDLVAPGDEGWDRWHEEAVGLLVVSSKITADDIAKCKHLKYISRHGVGYDNVNAEAARASGIAVTNCPGINAGAVAEMAVALTFSLARHITTINERVRQGQLVAKKDAFSAMTLTGKTIGILGGGNIGFQYARIMHAAFACKIILYDPYLRPDSPWNSLPHKHIQDLDKDLYPLCDVISLHVPLLDSTRGMIGTEQFALMKPSVLLTNTSRGGIIDEDDLFTALEAGRIAGAGIDAWVSEPPTVEHYGKRLLHPRLISTPHIGAATHETQSTTCKSMCDHMFAAITGQPIPDRVI